VVIEECGWIMHGSGYYGENRLCCGWIDYITKQRKK